MNTMSTPREEVDDLLAALLGGELPDLGVSRPRRDRAVSLRPICSV